MNAIVFCGEEAVLTILDGPLPRSGEEIVVEKEVRREFKVDKVSYIHRFVGMDKTIECFDHRIEIHVTETDFRRPLE